MVRPGGHQDCAYLVKLIVQQQITTSISSLYAPSIYRGAGVKACSSLRQVICSGEALPWELQQRFFTCLMQNCTISMALLKRRLMSPSI